MKLLQLAAAMIGGIALSANAEVAVPVDPPTADAEQISRPDVQAMSIAEIRRFNTTVPVKHRYFIVCKQSTVTGSLAKVRRVCQTRDDWERSARAAQDGTQDVLERSRATSGCHPFCEGHDPS